MRASFIWPRSAAIAAAAFLLPALWSATAQNTTDANAGHFNYNAMALPEVNEVSVHHRGNISIHDITFTGSSGDTIPAYLVVPPGKGKFAAILWGHWLMPNSPSANRDEFLDEAVAIAPAGIVSLLIDAPQARPGFKPTPNPALIAQQVIDLRRAADLLLARPDVDPKRIAYVGHSWDAGTGAILDAVDKRFAAFVFMSRPQSNRQYVLESDSPRMIAARKGIDKAKVEHAMQTTAWADPGSYAKQLGPAPALFQYGLHDEEWVPLQDAKDYFAMATGPKEVKFYDSGHALNEQARIDRFKFLQQHLTLAPLPSGVIESVPGIE